MLLLLSTNRILMIWFHNKTNTCARRKTKCDDKNIRIQCILHIYCTFQTVPNFGEHMWSFVFLMRYKNIFPLHCIALFYIDDHDCLYCWKYLIRNIAWHRIYLHIKIINTSRHYKTSDWWWWKMHKGIYKKRRNCPNGKNCGIVRKGIFTDSN